MVAFILPANSATGGYEVSNSLKFRSANSAQMSQGNGTQTNAKKWSVSFWIKLVAFADASRCVYSATGSSSTGSSITFVNNTLVVGCQGVSETDWVGTLGSSSILFRDPSAWYNICIGFDSTQGTAANRLRGYVNGVEHTFNTLTSPTQNEDSNFNNGSDSKIGGNITNNSHNLDAYISQFYFIDGTQYAASDFGKTNENGVWIPKAFGGTFGNNGTFVEGDSTTADASGNGNNYGQSAVIITTDTPTNNFCTWNPLVGRAASYSTFAEGNLDAKFTSGSIYLRATGSIGVTSGKWYAEMKCISDGGNDDLKVGVEPINPDQTDVTTLNRVIQSWNGYKAADVGGGSFGDSYTDGDIVGIYLDMDNGTIKFSKNGTMMASSASAYTDLVSAMPHGGWAFFSFGYDNANIQANFGNAPFSISSSNADANGYGSFEYSPTLSSTNYYALCTKNLAEYG